VIINLISRLCRPDADWRRGSGFVLAIPIKFRYIKKEKKERAAKKAFSIISLKRFGKE
jgi:hypothetical protein